MVNEILLWEKSHEILGMWDLPLNPFHTPLLCNYRPHVTQVLVHLHLVVYFILLLSLYNVYILHQLALKNSSSIQLYISNLGIRTEVLCGGCNFFLF